MKYLVLADKESTPCLAGDSAIECNKEISKLGYLYSHINMNKIVTYLLVYCHLPKNKDPTIQFLGQKNEQRK